MEDQVTLHVEHPVFHAVLLIIFSFLACIAVASRLWARRIQKLALALSDFVIILGLVFALAESGANIYGCCFPEAWKTAAQKSNMNQTFGLQLAFVSPIIWVLAVTAIRASIIFLYVHIFPTRSFRLACCAALAFNMLFLIATVLADCLICHPISYRWDYTAKGGYCGDERSLSLYIAIVNLIQDMIVVVLPMRVLWRLQMATHRKAAVSCIFGLGIAYILPSHSPPLVVGRTLTDLIDPHSICAVTSYRVYVTSTITDPSSRQSQEAYSLIALLTSLESLVGIITCCLPMLRPVANTLWNSLPKSGRKKISTYTFAATSIVARAGHVLSVPHMSHHPKSFVWFSTRSGSYATQVSSTSRDQGLSSTMGKDEVEEVKPGQIHVRRDVEVESAFSDY